MSIWIDIIRRITIHIPKPIPRHWIHRLRHNRVRLGERAGQRVVESSAVVVQAGGRFPTLAGEEAVGQGDRQGVADDGAIRVILHLARCQTVFVGDQGGRAEACLELDEGW